MTLFGKRDQLSDAPKNVINDKNATGNAQFGNTVYGVDATETGVDGAVTHSGWVYRTLGTGPVASFVVNAAGTTYDNADTIDVEGGTGANAVGTFVTDASGNIVSVTVTSAGQGFANVGATSVTINTSTGTGANVEVATLGGRSDRVSIETLIAGGIDGDATSFSNASTTDVANTTGTADDAVFADS